MTYINVINDMYDGAKTQVSMVGGDLELFPVEMWLHQGSILSPFLFFLRMDKLTQYLDIRYLRMT